MVKTLKTMWNFPFDMSTSNAQSLCYVLLPEHCDDSKRYYLIFGEVLHGKGPQTASRGLDAPERLVVPPPTVHK